MPTGLGGELQASDPEAVSILVLLDDAYRLLPSLSSFLKHSLFQSLFFWMMPTGGFWQTRAFCYVVVSILVLLDDAYRRNQPHLAKRISFCFNPCSSG